MSINEKLFEQVYEECLSVIDATNDINVKSKKTKFETAYQSMREELDPDSEHKDFNSDVHELRTYQYLIDKGFSVSATNDNKAGPDFNVKDLGYVECVICTRGKPGAEPRKYVDEQLAGESNRYRAALPRLTAAIKEKRDKYAKYLCQGIISPDIPRIIAVGATIFSNLVHADSMVELTEQILCGAGEELFYCNKKTGQFLGASGVETRCYNDSGKKTIKKELKLNYFALDEYCDVSAVILINNSIGEKLTDAYFSVFLNPNATVPVPVDALKTLNYLIRTDATEQKETYQWHKNGSQIQPD